MTDGRTDRRTDRRTDGGDCNIPIAFLKKRGDKDIGKPNRITFDKATFRMKRH